MMTQAGAKRRFVKLDLVAVKANEGPLRQISDGALKVYVKMLAFICRSKNPGDSDPERRALGEFFRRGLLVCDISQKGLADSLDKNRCTIRKLLKELVDKRWIATVGEYLGKTIYSMGTTGAEDGVTWERMLLEETVGVAPTEPEGVARTEPGGMAPTEPSQAMGVAPTEPQNSMVPSGNQPESIKAAARAAADDPKLVSQGEELDLELIASIRRELVNLDNDATGPIDTNDLAIYIVKNSPTEEIAEEVAKSLYRWHKKLRNNNEPIVSLYAAARTVIRQVTSRRKDDTRAA